MAYFEELLQDFKEGAKLKLSDWEQGEYIWLGNDNQSIINTYSIEQKNQSTITKEDFFIELLIANLIGNLVILKSSLATEKSNLTKAYENYVVNLINLYKETNQ